MRCILNSCFFVGRNLTVVIGLRKEAEEFNPRIALVSYGGEKIIFSPEEFYEFSYEKNSMKKYFDGGATDLKFKLPNHEILVAAGSIKEIVIRSRKTYHTVRIGPSELELLSNLQLCIDRRIEKIIKKQNFCNFILKTLLSDTKKHFDGIILEATYLYRQTLQQGLILPPPPSKVKIEEIKDYLFLMQSDEITLEIVRIYGEELAEQVFSTLHKNPETTFFLPELFDDPF